jgi:hypothetical protein
MWEDRGNNTGKLSENGHQPARTEEEMSYKNDAILDTMMNAPALYISDIMLLIRVEFAEGRLSPNKFQVIRNRNGHEKDGRIRNYDTIVLYHTEKHRFLRSKKTCYHLYHPQDDRYTELTAIIDGHVHVLLDFRCF